MGYNINKHRLDRTLKSKEYIVDGLWTYYFSKSELKKMLREIGFKVRIGSILLLIYPHNRNGLLFCETSFASKSQSDGAAHSIVSGIIYSSD